jgi:hypothetical protein
MLPAKERLEHIEALLLDPDMSLRKRLIDAGRTFWSIARRDEDWPGDLQQAGDAIRVQLFAQGSVNRSVEAMPRACIEETAEELLLFVRAAARLHASRSQVPTDGGAASPQ